MRVPLISLQMGRLLCNFRLSRTREASSRDKPSISTIPFQTSQPPSRDIMLGRPGFSTACLEIKQTTPPLSGGRPKHKLSRAVMLKTRVSLSGVNSHVPQRSDRLIFRKLESHLLVHLGRSNFLSLSLPRKVVRSLSLSPSISAFIANLCVGRAATCTWPGRC